MIVSAECQCFYGEKEWPDTGEPDMPVVPGQQCNVSQTSVKVAVCFFNEQINYRQCLRTASTLKKTVMGQALSLEKGQGNKNPAPLIILAEPPYDVDGL